MRRIPTLAIAVVTAVALAHPAAAAGPQVVDPPGDANGLDQPGDTRPASHDPADVLSVTLDSIREDPEKDPVAFRFRIRTLAAPASSRVPIALRLTFYVDGCFNEIDVYVNEHPSVRREGDVEWFRWEGCATPTYRVTNPGWVLQLDGEGVTVTMPFSTLGPDDLALLGTGVRLEQPRVVTTFIHRTDYTGWAWFPWFDFTARGEDYVVGSDD